MAMHLASEPEHTPTGAATHSEAAFVQLTEDGAVSAERPSLAGPFGGRWAFGIVRADIAGEQAEACVAEVRWWASRYDFVLRGVACARSDERFPLLIATLGYPEVSAIVVPELAHLGGWAAAVRSEADLWTLHPLHRWKQLPAHPLPRHVPPGAVGRARGW